MNYNDFIASILNDRGNFGITEGYKERHHILPRCQGGTDEQQNLIDLTAQEHYEAHKLLALENPHNRGLQLAWAAMTNRVQNGGRYRDVIISAEEYAQIRIARSIALTGKGNPCYGRKHTEEECQRMRANHPNQFGENNNFYGKTHTEETRQKISKAKLGTHWSEEQHEQFRQNYKKENHPNYGKHLSEKTRQKIKESNKGKTAGMFWCVTLDGTKEHRFSECPEGWKPGRKAKGKPIIRIEDNKFYISIVAAAKELNNKNARSNINKCIHGKLKTAAGYHWRYATEEEIIEN